MAETQILSTDMTSEAQLHDRISIRRSGFTTTHLAIAALALVGLIACLAGTGLWLLVRTR